MTEPASPAHEPEYLTLLGMTLQLRFRKNQLSLHHYLEPPSARRDQLDGRVGKRLTNLGGQTGRPGLVASLGAVFDRYVHVGSRVDCDCKISLWQALNRCGCLVTSRIS